MPIMDQAAEKQLKQIRLKELNFGDTIRIMPLTKILSSLPFSYPAYKPDMKEKDKMLDGFAIFNSTPAGKEPSKPEKAMMEIFHAAKQNAIAAAAARARKRNQQSSYNPEKLEGVAADGKKGSWGFGFAQVGMQAVERGNICDVQLTEGQTKGIIQARSRLIGSSLEYTPLLCWLAITIEEGKEYFNNVTKKKEKAKALRIETIELDKGGKGLLPASFANCVTVHPDDMTLVRDWVKAYHQAVFSFSVIPPEPVYRDYPDEAGELCYVATQSVQDPIRLNVYKYGMSEGLRNAIANRDELYQYQASTEHSLLGGYFYSLESGKRRPVPMDEIRAGYVSNDNGTPIVNIDGSPRPISWHKGTLNQKKFNPLLLDEKEKYAFEDSQPEELEKMARKLGIPVKGDPDPSAIVDWDSYLNSSPVEVSRNAPVSNM